MNLDRAIRVAGDIPAHTEGDVLAAYRTLSATVVTYHRRNLPAPRDIYDAWDTTNIYLGVLNGEAA